MNEDELLDLADGWDESRRPPYGWLMPTGVILILAGFVGCWLALQMNVTASAYSSVVNVDAVGYRTLMFIVAISHSLVGWMLCCTALVIRTVARFS